MLRLRAMVSRPEMDSGAEAPKAARLLATWLRSLSSYADVNLSLLESREAVAEKEKEISLHQARRYELEEEALAAEQKAQSLEEASRRAGSELEEALKELEEKKLQLAVAERCLHVEGLALQMPLQMPFWRFACVLHPF